jgi:hypothetical protein
LNAPLRLRWLISVVVSAALPRPDTLTLITLSVRIPIGLANLAGPEAELDGSRLPIEQLAPAPDFRAVFTIPSVIDEFVVATASADIEILRSSQLLRSDYP